jgi:bifunctional UDP-N-acetylglucosamine pyrophosphorylase/glucosamine-1-phosphate N-acetyltransferase
MMTKTSVVIMAAGLGTRMKSKLAKVLHRAGGLTLLEHVIRTARAVAEPADIVAIVGHQAETVAALVEPLGVRTALQAVPQGTGHAVAQAKPLLEHAGGLLVILSGDVPLLSAASVRRLVDEHRASGKDATVLTCSIEDPAAYGRIVRDDAGDVAAIVEFKACDAEQKKIREINSGIYCFNSDLVWKYIGEIGTDNPAGEYYLTDLIGIFRRNGHKVGAMQIGDFTELLGINNKVELAEMDQRFRARKVRELMLEGVTIERPESVIVDVDVRVGRDVEIEANVRLTGATVIGQGTRIGTGSVIEDSTIGGGVQVLPYTIVSESEIGDGARVGPFARLRNHNQVGENCHIGNFVELKKTAMAAGAKANHLAYLGDAEIGSKSNIGAGTITCNYDGVHKHKTRIGEKAFIGSNSTLVAPVEVGPGAYVAAGSVITDAVPEASLALGRARQIVKTGWKPKKPAK